MPDGFAESDIQIILSKKERFFLELPLPLMGRRSKVYQEYIAFDPNDLLSKDMKLPSHVRGFSVLNDETVKWYRKRRDDNRREIVAAPTPDFWALSPDSIWSLPDLCEFLESGKGIHEYR